MTPRSLRDCPRSQPDLDGTGLTNHPDLGGLDRASCPIVPDPSGYSALRNRRTVCHRPGLSHVAAKFQSGKLNGVDGLLLPFIRRVKGSACEGQDSPEEGNGHGESHCRHPAGVLKVQRWNTVPK